MVKKMLFAVAILTLAVLGPGAGLLEAIPDRGPIPEYCTQGGSCLHNGHCGVDRQTLTYLGVCHNGACLCY